MPAYYFCVDLVLLPTRGYHPPHPLLSAPKEAKLFIYIYIGFGIGGESYPQVGRVSGERIFSECYVNPLPDR